MYIFRRPNNRKRKYYGGRRKAYVERERVPYEYDYEYEEAPEVKAVEVKVPNKKKLNSSVLEGRNKENRGTINEEKIQPKVSEQSTSKSSLFSQPRNPSILGIKIRREPAQQSSTRAQAPINRAQSAEKEVPSAPAEAEYSYEDYQIEEEPEKVVEKVVQPKQTRLPTVIRKQYTPQKRS